jgi:hypothetical protein
MLIHIWSRPLNILEGLLPTPVQRYEMAAVCNVRHTTSATIDLIRAYHVKANTQTPHTHHSINPLVADDFALKLH